MANYAYDAKVLLFLVFIMELLFGIPARVSKFSLMFSQLGYRFLFLSLSGATIISSAAVVCGTSKGRGRIGSERALPICMSVCK